MLRKSLFRIAIGALLIFVLTGTFGCYKEKSPALQTSTPRDQVTLNLNWLPEHPEYWIALEKGFWAEQNIDVKIIRGYGSGDTVGKIAMKQAEFGIADMGSLILARAKDENVRVKAVANRLTAFPAVIVYNEASGIKEPKDLEGKKIVGSANSAYRILFPAFAKANGIDQSKVQWKLVEPSLQQVAFIKGEVDAWTSHIENISTIEKLTGKPVYFFSYRDEGKLDCYGDSLIVHEDTIAQNPDLVRRFVAGYLKGIRYCIENPSEAGDIVKRHVPEIDAGLTTKGWQVTLENNILVSDESRKNGLGWMSGDRMANTIDSVLRAYDLQKEMSPETVYTSQFLSENPIYPPNK
ncbi:MAG: ABC transporter substrate-binding protein [Bacillota bacterium]